MSFILMRAALTPPASERVQTDEASIMMDFVSLGLSVAFFALSLAFVALCDRL